MPVITVTQLNRYVASVLDSDANLSDLRVSGEVSSLKRYPSGHIYFNLKDSECSVSCVMFRSKAVISGEGMKDGMKVMITARASLYDRDGKFQLYVNEVIPDGVGDLFAAFESLKSKLSAEGIFDESRKLPIPYLPKRIGVASSRSGAVIRDIINVLSRRFPGFDLQLIPVKVQGSEASASIIRALEVFNLRKEVDVIIIARGGGSMEHLWCFNDESLARAVASSSIPVISAVGHETDFTICDFAADLRAPTPSAAAELAVPDLNELLSRQEAVKRSLHASIMRKVEYSGMRLQNIMARGTMSDPSIIWMRHKEKLTKLSEALRNDIRDITENSINKLALASAALDKLSPLKVLSRGYSSIYNISREMSVKSIMDAQKGDRLAIRVTDGVIMSITESTGT